MKILDAPFVETFIQHKMFADESMLRDFFAALAMQKLINWTLGTGNSREAIAKASYKMADAMLEARKKYRA